MAATKTEQFCFFNVKIALESKVSISLRHKPGAQTSKSNLNVDKCLPSFLLAGGQKCGVYLSVEYGNMLTTSTVKYRVLNKRMMVGLYSKRGYFLNDVYEEFVTTQKALVSPCEGENFTTQNCVFYIIM